MNQQHITLTANAIKRLANILANEPQNSAMRIAVEGGGCSGFSYKFDITNTKNKDDYIINENGAVVYIDAISLPYMLGSQIDFVDDLVGKSFKIKNPNATASCGCGTSFSV